MLWTSRPTSSATSLLTVSSRDSPGTDRSSLRCIDTDLKERQVTWIGTDPGHRTQPEHCTSLEGRKAAGPKGTASHQTPGRLLQGTSGGTQTIQAEPN